MKKSILILSTAVFEYLNSNKLNKNETLTEIQCIEFEIKESILDLILYKSSQIISSDTPELFIKTMERTNKEIQLINLVFSKIVKEKYMLLQDSNTVIDSEKVKSPLEKYYFKQFVEKVLLNNSMSIFSKLIEYINKIGYALNQNDCFDTLLNCKNDEETKHICDFLPDQEQKDNYLTIQNMISIMTDLDFLTTNLYKCKNSFEIVYKNNLSKIYNVYGSTIKSIKNSRVEYKFRELLKILTLESFIHNTIFTESLDHKLLIQKELLEPNLSFIKIYLVRKLAI